MRARTDVTRTALLLALTGMIVLAGSAGVWTLLLKDTSLAQLKAGGVLRVGYAVEAPYAFVTSDGQVTGEAPETARLVADRLGLRIEWIQTGFSALIPELQAGRFDVVAAGLFITPERARLVSFSEPTLRVRAALLVRHGNPKALQSYADVIRSDDIRMAVIAGSVEERQLRSLGLAPSKLLSVPDAWAGTVAVLSGTVDSLALSLPTIRYIARDRADLAVVAIGRSDADSESYTAFAFSSQRPALLKAWNDAQASVVNAPARLDSIARFGFDAGDLPAQASLASLLAR